ncbi:MAG: hypothetical protein HN580_16530 [Deltaproteobacteria bacterium]|jgi:hypothetical protein|nr:hypothetical protein [Deltaproteobacteria bacterium]MBT7890626.1 hypothetical protein [Deltaproteobacteria bacterium]
MGDADEKSEKGGLPDSRLKIEACLEEMKAHDAYWKNRANQIYALKLDLTDPLFININHLRQGFRFYIIPALEKLLQDKPDRQSRFVRHLPFLFDQALMQQFLKHFYGVVKDEADKWEFEKRDVYEQDKLILYDLHKVKKTIHGVQLLLKDLDNRRMVFPSVFDQARQIELLKGMNSALFMAFKQTLKPEYQVELFKKIGIEYINEDQLAERKRQQITYAKPVDLETNPYRRTFLHIIFRNSIKTMIKQKKTVIEYDLVDFHQVLHEYFSHFIKDGDDDFDALLIYHSIHTNSKPLAQSIIDDPDPENLIFEEIDEIKTMV